MIATRPGYVPSLIANNPQAARFTIEFPEQGMSGSLGDAATILTAGTEIPRSLVYGALLTFMGAMCSGQLSADIGLESDTRLFTALLGESADDKKSSAVKRAYNFFQKMDHARFPFVQTGVGSGEGLAGLLKENANLLLMYDEFRTFIDKSNVQGSTLLDVTTSLFENQRWDNVTKGQKINIENARLSIVGCATLNTYGEMWTPEAINIGFVNRLFIVGAEKRSRVAWPSPVDAQRIQSVEDRVRTQLDRLPLEDLQILPDAQRLWEDWYRHLPTGSLHTRRLDTIGRRLMLILTLTMDKSNIDAEVVRTVLEILKYEFKIRCLTDPIDADDRVARMEEAIRRQLRTHGEMHKRDLQRNVNYDKVGIWAFNQAKANLEMNGEIEIVQQPSSKNYQVRPLPELRLS